jgi:hypothetical protein
MKSCYNLVGRRAGDSLFYPSSFPGNGNSMAYVQKASPKSYLGIIITGISLDFQKL